MTTRTPLTAPMIVALVAATAVACEPRARQADRTADGWKVHREGESSRPPREGGE